MTTQISIARDRLLTKGYRRFLQSLSHGALVDFIMGESNLYYTPNQELKLFEDELADSRARHARATQRINELVCENRDLVSQLQELAPANTANQFETVSANPDEFVKEFLQFLTGIGVAQDELDEPSEEIFETYSSIEEYCEEYPDAHMVKIASLGDSSLHPNVPIRRIEALLHYYDALVTVEENEGFDVVTLAVPTKAAADNISKDLIDEGVIPSVFADVIKDVAKGVI